MNVKGSREAQEANSRKMASKNNYEMSPMDPRSNITPAYKLEHLEHHFGIHSRNPSSIDFRAKSISDFGTEPRGTNAEPSLRSLYGSTRNLISSHPADFGNNQRKDSVTSIPPPVPGVGVNNQHSFTEGAKRQSYDSQAFAKSLFNLRSRDLSQFPTKAIGIATKDLKVYGYSSITDSQRTVGAIFSDIYSSITYLFGSTKQRVDILQNVNLLVQSGEMLLVLGPPGSGCSTLLKTIAGETHGFHVHESSIINYQGITAKQMKNMFRGEAIYMAEVDVHFPMLTVGETLLLAAQARAPRFLRSGHDKVAYAQRARDAIMETLGITHTIDSRIGNDFIRGISGGERKRVSIAEAALCQAPLQCWDNSTRGLDSANSLSFCQTLRASTNLLGTTVCVAIYQASENAYQTFDKVTLLYEGRQIFFGRCGDAKAFFVNMGFLCPERQTTADFLTSLTSPSERKIRPGFETKVPQTPDDFAAKWQSSDLYAQLIADINEFNSVYTEFGPHLNELFISRKAEKSTLQRKHSPYTLSYGGQILLCLRRGLLRLKRDPSLTLAQLIGNLIMALVIGSVFYNLEDTTKSFYQRGALLFFAILLNAFGGALEILTLYAQRPIVEKHARYAFYHPSCEAIASILTDLPYKILNTFTFNVTLYFMSNLRREPGPFFFFILISFSLTLTMSMLFRTIGSTSRTLAQAMAPAAILILAIVLFTGFMVPKRNMRPWCRFFSHIDPVSYAFEALMINEFHNRSFICSNVVPAGPPYISFSLENKACSALGSIAGLSTVSGDDYIKSAFQYNLSHKWRDFCIVIGFLLLFTFTYLAAAEYIPEKRSKGEVLVFRRGCQPKPQRPDVEANAPSRPPTSYSIVRPRPDLTKSRSIFHWQNLCYEIKLKNETKKILDDVNGWVKPGTLTALMGVSGAGKTTLLDVLARRVQVGTVQGEIMMNGNYCDNSFPRKIGYVQQQDLHLPTSTVREAITFSAILRQPLWTPRKEKLVHVQNIIKLLDMEGYAEAIVGVPGEGLNVEQRKRLTIAVELAAKPPFLTFLDEPTSGLDSQTSWVICDLMERLAKTGKAVLCTIHQPSAMLFQRFDRVLMLAKGGKTIYFGDIGKNSSIIIKYFERNGASPCPEHANPAEWILEVTGAAPGATTDIDWPRVWKESPELQKVREQIMRSKEQIQGTPDPMQDTDTKVEAKESEFASDFSQQLSEVTKRVFQQYWRTPSYIYSKSAVCLFSALFIGLVFYQAENTQQGLQNQMFAVFMLMTIFGQLTQQMMPLFVTQRALFEARERQSRTYSWKAFLLSNIIVEIPWNTLMAFLVFFSWYYPIGLYRNAKPTDAVYERSELMFLLILAFLIFTCTFCDMVIVGIETAEAGGSVANLIFSLSIIFCGVLATPSQLPRFWIFMYYVSPFTYLVSAMLSTAVAQTTVSCAENEYLSFPPPRNMSCTEYMTPYINAAGGYLRNPSPLDSCYFCPIANTDVFLAGINSTFSDAWRNFGIMWAYIMFNVMAAFILYWLFRVPRNRI